MDVMNTTTITVLTGLLMLTGLAPAVRAEANDLTADVCVIGGGSGGFASAIGAARAGARVILIEKQAGLGGTSARAYVCNWEPGVDGPLCREIYDRMSQIPSAVAVVKDHNPKRKLGRFGLWLPSPELTYDDTLRRAGLHRSKWRAMAFEPDALVKTVSDMLAETGRCRILLNTTCTGAEADGKHVTRVIAQGKDGTSVRIRATVVIDATGGAHICKHLGCEMMIGPEPRSRFNEPGAPKKVKPRLNAMSLCYRITPKEDPKRQPAPDPPVKGFPKVAHVSGLACGDRIINPLGLLPGQALIDDGYDACMQRARHKILAHWHWLQRHEAFADFELHSLAPMLGIRESYRVVGDYVLTQHDLIATVKGQKHPDLIALADHAMDVHGGGGPCGELKGPYGIPYRCLIPKGWSNLLVACRGASFSQIAASSCRLNRTMISIGHAAGTAAALAAKDDIPVADVDVAKVQAAVGLPELARKKTSSNE